MKINYPELPVLAVAFTHGLGPVGLAISAVTKSPYRHSLLITNNWGQKFGTEETFHGLQENSLEKYTKQSNRIIDMWYWRGWDDKVRAEEALCFLAEIRRKAGEQSKYDFKGLLSFVFPKLFKPDPKRQWCSENCLSTHVRFGFKTDYKPDRASPGILRGIMSTSAECLHFTRYYC
jgi:hypothetical protein